MIDVPCGEIDIPDINILGRFYPGKPSPCAARLIRFEDLDEVINFVEGTKDKVCALQDAYGNPVNTLTADGNDRLDAGDGITYKEAAHMARVGWRDGLDRSQGLLEDIESKFFHGKRIVPRQEYAVANGMPDIGAFLSNDPECFLSKVPEERFGQGKIARLRVCIGADAKVHPKSILTRGICVIAAIDALEKAGIATEVDAIMPGFAISPKLWVNVEIPLKKSNYVADDDRIAFCVGHPAFLRRYGFRIMQLMACTSRNTLGVDWCDLFPQKGDIAIPPLRTLPGYEDAWNDPQMVIDLCFTELEKSFRIF